MNRRETLQESWWETNICCPINFHTLFLPRPLTSDYFYLNFSSGDPIIYDVFTDRTRHFISIPPFPSAFPPFFSPVSISFENGFFLPGFPLPF